VHAERNKLMRPFNVPSAGAKSIQSKIRDELWSSLQNSGVSAEEALEEMEACASN